MAIFPVLICTYALAGVYFAWRKDRPKAWAFVCAAAFTLALFWWRGH